MQDILYSAVYSLIVYRVHEYFLLDEQNKGNFSFFCKAII